MARTPTARVEDHDRTTTRPAVGARVRTTRQAIVIEDVLRKQDGFRTAQQLHTVITSSGEKVGLTTVYRFLNHLAEQGRADVVHNPDGEAQFRLCRPELVDEKVAGEVVDHHHHVVCRTCGRSAEVNGPEVEEWAARVAKAAGYTDITHTVEVFGLCAEHSPRPRSRARRPATHRD